MTVVLRVVPLGLLRFLLTSSCSPEEEGASQSLIGCVVQVLMMRLCIHGCHLVRVRVVYLDPCHPVSLQSTGKHISARNLGGLCRYLFLAKSMQRAMSLCVAKLHLVHDGTHQSNSRMVHLLVSRAQGGRSVEITVFKYQQKELLLHVVTAENFPARVGWT